MKERVGKRERKCRKRDKIQTVFNIFFITGTLLSKHINVIEFIMYINYVCVLCKYTTSAYLHVACGNYQTHFNILII